MKEASVRALASWPAKGVPRDPLAWLVVVGRNVAIDERRRARREEELPTEAALSDVSDEESAMATSLDDGHYRDDVLRLLFMCCHPTLAAEQQIALALRIVSGLTVVEIARAFMVSPSAVGQRIARAKRRIAEENVPYKDVRTINEHLQNLFEEGEVDPAATIRKFRIVQAEGSREVARLIEHYNLDVILAVGYRVRSHRGTQFRRWATERLTEYLTKGFVLDDERLKEGRTLGADYFDDLLERIREIRSSEKRFYQKIRDLYALAIDYDPATEQTTEFFQIVQNKLHWAVTASPRMRVPTSVGTAPRVRSSRAPVPITSRRCARAGRDRGGVDR